MKASRGKPDRGKHPAPARRIRHERSKRFPIFVQKSFAHDLAGATCLLAGLPEDKAARI